VQKNKTVIYKALTRLTGTIPVTIPVLISITIPVNGTAAVTVPSTTSIPAVTSSVAIPTTSKKCSAFYTEENTTGAFSGRRTVAFSVAGVSTCSIAWTVTIAGKQRSIHCCIGHDWYSQHAKNCCYADNGGDDFGNFHVGNLLLIGSSLKGKIVM
jgi:hypothetical protein